MAPKTPSQKKAGSANLTQAPAGPVDFEAALASAPLTEYVPGERGQTGGALLQVLVSREGRPMTEPMLASAIGALREDGKPRQQAVNGPMRHIWERIAKEGKQPEALASQGLVLRCAGARVGGRVVKVWLVEPAQKA